MDAEAADTSVAVGVLAEALEKVRAVSTEKVATETGLSKEDVQEVTNAIDLQTAEVNELSREMDGLAKEGELVGNSMKNLPVELPPWQD